MARETSEAPNEKLLTQIVKPERRIGELQVELARHRSGRAASALATITISARDTEMNDRRSREFVQRLAG